MKSALSESVIHYILGCSCQELAELDTKILAEIFHISRSKLKEKFKNMVQLELEYFIEQEKIHRALRMIEETDGIDCSRFAEILGFQNLEQFRETFKNILLVDPETYMHLRIQKKKAKGGSTTIPVRIAPKQRYIYA